MIVLLRKLHCTCYTKIKNRRKQDNREVLIFKNGSTQNTISPEIGQRYLCTNVLYMMNEGDDHYE